METIPVTFELWPKQQQAFDSPANEILFGGATEGGKSHLMRVLLCVFSLMVPGLQSVLIRKKYDDIVKNHVYGPTGFLMLLKELIEHKQVVVTKDEVRFANGSVISFQHCQDERQFDSAQGVEKHILAIDEAPQISQRLILFFRGWVRMPLEFKAKVPPEWRDKLPMILYTGNPIGPSAPWFRREFVKARPEGAIEYVHGFKRQYIKSRAVDNLSVDQEAHKGRLAGIGDAALAKALDEGDWDSPVGEFFSEWDESRHVIPDFVPPAHWFRYRCFDWGSKDPFAVVWFAVSDGEMFETTIGSQQKRLWFPRGSKLIYREWYGCDEHDPAKGIGMRNAEIARGILERSPGEEEKNLITLTDSYPFPDRGEEGGETIAKVFARNGVPLTLGDTSRVTGWAAMRDCLIGQQLDLNSEDRFPMLYVMEQCRFARDYIPTLPRHKNEAKKINDAAEEGEATHICDAIRLGCLATARIYERQEAQVDKIKEQARRLTPRMTFDDALTKVRRHKEASSGRSY